MAPVHVTGRHFQRILGMPEVTYDVLYCGERYQCDSLQLQKLYDGADPEDDLGLTRIEDDDDD